MIKINTLARLILLSCLLVSSFAQGKLENIRFQRVTLEQGLSQETVFAIHQDSQGFMWFGTQEGLNRYDGYSFKVFSHNDRDPQSLSNDLIYSIAEDTSNNLWVGTASGGVSVFNKATQNFTHFKHDSANPTSISSDLVRVILKDKDGNLWLGTENGLNKYLPESKAFQHIAFSATGTEQRQGPTVWTITQDKNNFLWVGTDGDGLYRLNPLTHDIQHYSVAKPGGLTLSSDRIRSLMVDDANRLWIGSYDKGLDINDLSTQSNVSLRFDQHDTKSLSNNNVKSIYQDTSGTVWVATDFGLNRYEEATNNFSRVFNEDDNRYSLAGNKLTSLFQDQGGVFWVGGFSGLSKWNTATANFKHYRVHSDIQQSLSDNSVNAFAQGPTEDIWIGTHNGLNKLNLSTSTVQTYYHDTENPNSISSNRVMSLHGNGNTLWIGTRNNGMNAFDIESEQFSHFKHDPDDSGSLSSNAITSIRYAGKNKIWVTTFGGGLNLFNTESKRVTRFKADPNNPVSIASDRLFVSMTDSSGMLWLGTWGAGANIFNPATETAIQVKHDPSNPNSLSSDNVISLLEDAKGNIWLGTQGAGLNRLSSKNRQAGNFTFDRITRHEGLPSNVVYGIVEDQAGAIWLSTNRGISKYDPLTNDLINYDSSHGLQGNEFHYGAYLKTTDGQFFFGGSNGVTAFYPELIKPNAHVPPVVLTNFLRLNESVSPSLAMNSADAIQINYQDYLIAFEFAGLDFASPSNNQYSYMLEGFDDDWIQAGGLRRATYTNLPAGNYQFKVKASNNDGVWNEQGANLALTVLPAPWYSWWAYLGYCLIAVMLLAFVVRSYLGRLQKEAQYRIKLEEEVENRTQELRRANEQLLNASVTDQLTGLHNRRYLSSIIESECAKLTRDIRKLSKRGHISSEAGPRLFCLMFDLDGFKPINDTYGHDAGDQIISQVSDLLRKVCRQSDTVIRWGGDEFLIVGRVEDIHEVTILAERLRKGIVSTGFDIGVKHRLHVSCSIGYSLYPFAPKFVDAFTWEQVQIIADRAMYCSKDAGRNHWTGIVATDKQPAVSMMNLLVNDLDHALKKGFVTLKEGDKPE